MICLGQGDLRVLLVLNIADIMYDPDAPVVTLEDIYAARDIQYKSGNVVCTPTLAHVQDVFEVDSTIDLYIKCENMQVTGEVTEWNSVVIAEYCIKWLI